MGPSMYLSVSLHAASFRRVQAICMAEGHFCNKWTGGKIEENVVQQYEESLLLEHIVAQ
jgi:hypothetical protein